MASRQRRHREILDTVVALANGIPLILRLALRLVEAGGRVEDLPRDLPPEIVAGYLYGRILDRVQNPELKPVATAALVLRRFTVDMIDGVLAGSRRASIRRSVRVVRRTVT